MSFTCDLTTYVEKKSKNSAWRRHVRLYQLFRIAKLKLSMLKCMYEMKISKLRVRYFWGRITNFNQSEARKHCFFVSDWLKYETLPRKYRTLYSVDSVKTLSNYFCWLTKKRVTKLPTNLEVSKDQGSVRVLYQ